jgi:2-oxoglutarate dehydrogenase E1 component
MDKFSYFSNAETEYIDNLYKQYLSDPESVDMSWRSFFEGFEFSRTTYGDKDKKLIVPNEFKVINLINEYRKRGHLFTRTNPVRTRRSYTPTLDIENFGLTKEDLDVSFEAGSEIGIGKAPLRKIIEHLEATYCRSIGVEYAHIRNVEIEQWLRNRMESGKNTPKFSIATRKIILEKLGQAVFMEKFLHKRFPGQKRFSLEGVEALIPALTGVIEKGASLGAEEFHIGMAHRGRLNVLANILGKPMVDIYNEFSNKDYEDETLMGDVKYHLGYTTSRTTLNGKKVNITLAPNPSHLEAVGAIVQGMARAEIDLNYKGDTDKIVPIIIHGDASIAGQGIVYELVQMSELKGFRVGGSIHLIVNNQVGFTTNYLDARSSTYSTDIAKVIQSPIFHVNADDIEAVVYTIQLAMEYREKFDKDVFIDLLGYRKYGHNEGDEPRFTQPVLYKIIESHPDPWTIYSAQLIEKGVVTQEEADKIQDTINARLENELDASKKTEKAQYKTFLGESWKDTRYAEPEDFISSPNTGVSYEVLRDIGEKITRLPEDKIFNRKLLKLMEERNQMIQPGHKIDWAMGELLAYGSLVREGIPVRLSGQDSERGTFSHRHAVLTIEDSEEKYIPLNKINNEKASFSIYNSLLSEYAVLGFEYGYSLVTPNALNIWEAQFGDFYNGAQIIVDQYLSSAEDKWRVMSNLVLYLPHGYEGQGPEHSSGRMERFLVLAAENNMQIVNCTTPANLFHLLRRQNHRPFRKPLVLFTPKSLLRNPACVSPIEELTFGGFREVIDDETADPEQIERVVFTSGKVYYELVQEREKRKFHKVAIVRLEQIYPYPQEQIRAIVEKYSNATRFLWVQEEPANMGAWPFIMRHYKENDLLLVARPESGSPATGNSNLHHLQQEKIMQKTYGECNCDNSDKICKMLCAPKEWVFVPETEKSERE